MGKSFRFFYLFQEEKKYFLLLFFPFKIQKKQSGTINGPPSPASFNLLIGELDEGIGCKFADGRKLGVADTPESCAVIQKDLNRLER